MSDRRSEVQNENPNPAEYFLQWESNHQKLSYWDKEKEAKQLVSIPFKFLWLKQMITIKGYNDEKGGIYSNEVENANDILNVKYFKNGEIASGTWSEIKQTVESHNGKFCFSIYAMTEKGILINLNFSGASASSWYDFTKKTRKRLPDEWVSLSGFKEGKKGAVTYYIPSFVFDGQPDNETALIADEKYDEIKSYLEKYLKKPVDTRAEKTADEMDILTNGEKEVNTDEFEVPGNDTSFLDGNEAEELPF